MGDRLGGGGGGKMGGGEGVESGVIRGCRDGYKAEMRNVK